MYESEMEKLFWLAENVFSIYITVRIMNLFMGKQSRHPQKNFFIGVIYWIAACLCTGVYHNKMIDFMIHIVGMVLLAVGSYRQKLWKKLLAVCFILAVRIGSEALIWLFLKEQPKIPGMMVSTIQLFGLFLIQVILERFFIFQEEIPVPRRYYLCMILMPVEGIVLMMLLIQMGAMVENRMVIILAVTVVLVMIFTMLFFFDNLMKMLYEKWQNQFLEDKVEMYENQLQILSQSREKVHSLRHDLKTHFYLIKEFAKGEKREELLTYIEQMCQSMAVEQEIVSTGNEEVDAILNYRLEKVKKTGAEISLKLNIPRSSFCSSFDLNILLSNLLDNAVEALENSEKKMLIFRLELEKGVLYLEIKNSFSGRINRKNGCYLTLKEEKEYHGIGLANARKVVEKYGGSLVITQEEGLFCVNTVLLLGEI